MPETIRIQRDNADRSATDRPPYKIIAAAHFDPGRHTRYDEAASEDERVDVADYHVGGGWYDVPGADKNVRKAEAERLLGGDA